MKPVQFTIKDSLLAMVLIAAGLAAMFTVLRLPTRDALPIPLILGLWFGGASASGAGLFVPFRLARLGAILGLVLQVIFTWYMIVVVGMC